MSHSAVILSKVAQYTNIQPSDSRTVSVAKCISGISLKVTLAVTAIFETVARAALFLLGMPLLLIAPEISSDLTAQIKSAATTILDAMRALAIVHAPQEKQETPAAASWRDTFNTSLDKVKSLAGTSYAKTSATVGNHPYITAAIVGGVLSLIAVYGYHTLFVSNTVVEEDACERICRKMLHPSFAGFFGW